MSAILARGSKFRCVASRKLVSIRVGKHLAWQEKARGPIIMMVVKVKGSSLPVNMGSARCQSQDGSAGSDIGRKQEERQQGRKISGNYHIHPQNGTAKIPIGPYGSYSNEVFHAIVVPAAWHNLTYISPSSNKLKLHGHNPTLSRCHTRILEPCPDASRNRDVSRCETPDVHI